MLAANVGRGWWPTAVLPGTQGAGPLGKFAEEVRVNGFLVLLLDN
jgi:hypothetical protein